MDARGAGVVATVCLMGAVAAFAWSVSMYRTEQTLEARGLRTPGKVTEQGRTWSLPRGQNSYWLKVKYQVDGSDVVRKFGVSIGTYRLRGEDDVVMVLYDPQDPQVAQLVGGDDAQSRTMFVVIGVVCSVVALAGFFAARAGVRGSSEWREPGD